MRKSFSLVSTTIVLLSLFSFPVEARENVTDWYIKDFRAEFEVHADSTMTVIEWITADCGNCVGKHGIFRVLPTVATTPNGDIQTPIELIGITDFSGKPHPYAVRQNTSLLPLYSKFLKRVVKPSPFGMEGMFQHLARIGLV